MEDTAPVAELGPVAVDAGFCAIACAYHDMFETSNTVPPRVTNRVGWFQQASDELALSVYEELASRVARHQKV